ncbi:hypothetical protein B0H66DRAFT_608992 [Apodospora peruviana]|uniref:Uncharacterized protein n=1 Tax=Apodospora peruviana TaxID=516989 RepID=A0AAE0LY00_9PEZI|nr:hypothetical protein B0H66DRAFT_608992 [Apodospora peruviana]
MVGKGLLVTLVLDYCYSGSVLPAGKAQGANVRSLDYNPTVDKASPQDPGPFGAEGPLRNAEMLERWLINPDGYTILAACCPQEESWELTTKGEKRGHLRIRFRTSWPRQTPMCYGEKNFSSRVAHGVHKGDKYVVYPFDTSEDVASRTSQTSLLVRVENVHCLTSDLVGVEETASAVLAASVVSQIETGWKAKQVTHLSPRKTSVRLLASASPQLLWTEAERQQRFLHLCTDDGDTEPCIFHVALNEQKEYEIQDGSLERIPSFPTIPRDEPGASHRVMDALKYLAAFKFFEGVENRAPNRDFEGSFSFLMDEPGASWRFRRHAWR